MPTYFLRRILLCTAIAGASLHAGLAIAGSLEETNKKVVLDFFETVLNGRDADAAPRFVAEGYIQHNPRIPDGIAPLQDFVRNMRRTAPDAHATIKRVVAEGNLVVVHSHNQRTPQERGMAQVDIFRVDAGKLVEHWDVFQPVPETAANANGMF